MQLNSESHLHAYKSDSITIIPLSKSAVLISKFTVYYSAYKLIQKRVTHCRWVELQHPKRYI